MALRYGPKPPAARAEGLRAELRVAARQSRELRRLHRLHAVLLVSLGHGSHEVAAWFGEAPRTVERWVRAVEEHGADGLCDRQRIGRPTRLTAAQQELLALDLRDEPRRHGYIPSRWSGKLIAVHVERRFGVAISPRSCLRYLHRVEPVAQSRPAKSSRRTVRTGQRPVARAAAESG